MHVFNILEAIRSPRGLSIYLDGDKSLRRLRSFLVGYDGGLGQCGVQLEGHEELRAFEQWVAKQLEFGGSTCGWCNMILSKAGSDERAFDMFFELLDRFKQETNFDG